MRGTMHTATPTADRPNKPLSLRERMTMLLSHRSATPSQQLKPHEPVAQLSGRPQEALQASSASAACLPASTTEASGNIRLQSPKSSASAADPSDPEHDTAAAQVDEGHVATHNTSAACQASGDCSDPDLTQEDLPVLSQPCDNQAEHQSPQQEVLQLTSPVHSTSFQEQIHQEVNLLLNKLPEHRQPHWLRQQQQQQEQQEEVRQRHQQQQRQCSAQDGQKAVCGELDRRGAFASTAQHSVCEAQHLSSSEPQVIHLEDESADDLLDALANAAAEAPEAVQDADRYRVPILGKFHSLDCCQVALALASSEQNIPSSAGLQVPICAWHSHGVR